jgi:hypothetical protein
MWWRNAVPNELLSNSFAIRTSRFAFIGRRDRRAIKYADNAPKVDANLALHDKSQSPSPSFGEAT